MDIHPNILARLQAEDEALPPGSDVMWREISIGVLKRVEPQKQIHPGVEVLKRVAKSVNVNKH